LRTRAHFTPCKLFYDGWESIAVGDYFRTPAGSAYLIQAVRQNRNRPYRRHMDCVRWPADEIPDGATVHPLHWYPRKRRSVTLRQLEARACT
jgi:hypothetical protein